MKSVKNLFLREGPNPVCYKNVFWFLKRSPKGSALTSTYTISNTYLIFLRLSQVTLYLSNFLEHKKSHQSILLARQNFLNQYEIRLYTTRTIFGQHVFLFCATLNMLSRHLTFSWV